MEEGTKTEEIGFEKINEIDTKEVTTQTENIETNEKEIILPSADIVEFNEALKDLQEDLSNEEIIEKLSKVTKEDIEYIKTNSDDLNLKKDNAMQKNKIVLDEDSKINEKLLRLLAISGKLGEQGIIQATQTLENTELGQLFAIKEFGELIVETAKFSIALSKAVGKEIDTINNEHNNTKKDNSVSYDEYLASKTQQKTKEINANLGDKIEIKIGEAKVKIGIDYVPIKERNQNNVHNKDTKIKDSDIQR